MKTIDAIKAILEVSTPEDAMEVKDYLVNLIYTEISRLEASSGVEILDYERDSSNSEREKIKKMNADCNTLMTMLRRFYGINQIESEELTQCEKRQIKNP